jgi:hypothetical protein
MQIFDDARGFGDQTASSDALVEVRQNYDSAIDRNIIQDRGYRLCEKFEGEQTFLRDPEPFDGMQFWRDRSSFESTIFAANTKKLTMLNWLLAGFLFHAELIAVIVLTTIPWSRRAGPVKCAVFFSDSTVRGACRFRGCSCRLLCDPVPQGS